MHFPLQAGPIELKDDP